jgi:hypothetical protein
LASTVYLKNDALAATGYIGFSWTVFFFGFFVPLFRGDYKWFVLMLIADICTLWAANVVLAFIYNKIYTRSLIEDKGYVPSDGYSRQLLASVGILRCTDPESDIQR